MRELFGAAGNSQGFGGATGDPNADPFAAMFGKPGGAQAKPKTTDAFIVDRFPFLQKVKPFVMIGFFAFCYYRGWVGRWGLVMGVFSKSYFDMLGVPLRVLPNPIGTGKAFIVCQFYVDSLLKLIGYAINVARGKAKFPPDLSSLMPQMPSPGATDATGASPGGFPFSQASPTPTAATVMPPTMPTVAPSEAPPRPAAPPPRSAPTIVDADVTFLD